jgi:hypothetical protein
MAKMPLVSPRVGGTDQGGLRLSGASFGEAFARRCSWCAKRHHRGDGDRERQQEMRCSRVRIGDLPTWFLDGGDAIDRLV